LQQIIDVVALFDQHNEYIRHQTRELEWELSQCQTLESEVESLNKLLFENEEELAQQDVELADVRLRESSAKEACISLTEQLNERARDLIEVKALLDTIESRYMSTSSSNNLLQTELRVTIRIQKAAEEAQQALESRMKSVEESKQVVMENLKKY
jgi:chromosome segregation ATPase